MARADDIETDLTLELDGSAITPAKFRQGVDAFVGLLEALTRAVCRDEQLVEWRMQVKAGSNLVGAFAAEGANPQHVRHILSLVGQGLDQFDIAGEVPPIYPDTAVRHVQNLAGLTVKKEDDDTRIGIWVKKQRREITPSIKAAAKSALKSGFDEIGTVEGQLSVLNDRGGVHFVIYERIWDHAVRCTVPENLVEKMMTLWRRRVAAHGLVRYRPDGVPTNINADEIESLPEDKNLPTHEDVKGILRKRA